MASRSKKTLGQAVPSRNFRLLTVSTAVAIFGLITLGGVVRSTGSGDACPDWPLCHGRLIPPLEGRILIEYSHRLLTILVTVLVIWTVVWAWLRYRDNLYVLTPALAGATLLVLQVVLGGVTVLTGLNPMIVMAHWAVAQVFFTAFLLVALASSQFGSRQSGAVSCLRGDRRYVLLVSFVIAVLYLALITGSYVVSQGANTACFAWPLCSGLFWPNTGSEAVHMLHRYVVLAAAISILVLIGRTWRFRASSKAIWNVTMLLGLAFLGQMMLGAVYIWSHFASGLQAAHIAMGTIVWALAITAAFAVIRARQSLDIDNPWLKGKE